MLVKNIIPFIALLLCGTFILSCEDVVEVDLDPGNNQLVVDAWINNQNQPQVVRLVRTSPYFNSDPSPAETGATVLITDNLGNTYQFKDEDNDGSYSWESPDGVPFGEVGATYTLSITTANNRQYTATSIMNRVMPIDSIVTEEREGELGQADGLYAQFYAVDFAGEGDAYWIKTFKNGAFLNKPAEMNLAYDASFTPGGNLDGIAFITPIREAVNRIPDTADGAVDNSDFPPYAPGDSIRVEIHSLTEDAYWFLIRSRTQMTLGDAALFAEPPSNVSTNIIPQNATEPGDQAVGFFNVAAVSELGRRL